MAPHSLDALATIGNRTQFPAQVADVQVFAVLPYPVRGLVAKLEADSASRGGEIEGTIAVDGGRARPERHAIRLDVTSPDGNPVRYLTRVLEAKRGRASFSLPLALNEPTGTWTLTFTDATTGAKATARAEVR